MKIKGKFIGSIIKTKKGAYMRRLLVADDLHFIHSDVPEPLQQEGEVLVDVRFQDLAFLNKAA